MTTREPERHALVVGVRPELRERYQTRIAPERVAGALWQPMDEIWHLS
jgi:hypothetical protein